MTSAVAAVAAGAVVFVVAAVAGSAIRVGGIVIARWACKEWGCAYNFYEYYCPWG